MTQPFSVMFAVLGGGGAEMNAVRLAAGLVEEGIQPIYAVARGPGSYAEHLPPGVDEIILPTGASTSSTMRMLQAVRPLARLIDERRPDCLCPVLVTPSLVALLARRLARHQPAAVLSIQNTLKLPAGPAGILTRRSRTFLLAVRSPVLMASSRCRTEWVDTSRNTFPVLQAKLR